MDVYMQKKAHDYDNHKQSIPTLAAMCANECRIMFVGVTGEISLRPFAPEFFFIDQ